MLITGRFLRRCSTLAQSSAVISLAVFSACTSKHQSDQRQGIDPQPAVAAASNVKDSLGSAKAASALPADLSPGNQDQVIIQKTALDKEFLFSGSSIPQIQAATSTGIVGRVVMFRREGKKVFMLESTQGQVVSPTLPATLILASFPILSETATSLVIDFNKGMSQIFNDSGMYASDQTGFDFQPTTDAEPVRRSYLESVQIVGNILEIRQAAQVPEPAPLPSGAPAGTAPGTSFNGYEFRYYLEPYHPNPNFTPLEVKQSDFQHVGFFEVNPVIEPVTGRSVTRAAMRDLSKPVVYAISSNTPAQYHDAVRNGILYWNKVFGREVVQAVDAPAGVTAPDPRYNIIQWVENDSAGFAYADVLTDPRSGEILHSQVYLTSVFGTATFQEVPKVVREYEPTSLASFQKGLFSSSRVCERGADPAATEAVAALQMQGPLDPSVYTKIVNNYVQFVVTHEVGHTLGLRHNFAGSLASTATPDATDQMFADYILKGTVPPKGQLFASSVMDYNSLSEDVLHVSMFNTQNLILPYDQMAINWAYARKPIDISSPLPPFCTDTQASVLADCLTFDRGAKPIVANQQAINKSLRLLGFTLAETYINAKFPADPRDVIAFAQVPLDPDAVVKPLIDSLKSQIGWLKTGNNKSIAVMNQFPFITNFFNSEMNSVEDASVAEQVGEAGGVAKVLLQFISGKNDPTASIAAAANTALSTYLQRSDVKNGLMPNGQPYSLTDSDIGFIKTIGQKYFKQIEDRSFDQAMDQLKGGSYTNPKLAAETEQTLGSAAEKIIITNTTQVIAPSPAVAPAQGKPANAFAFSVAQRVAATQLLNASLGASDQWSVDARQRIAVELNSYLTSVMGQDPGKVDLSTLTEPLRSWFIDQVSVLNQVVASAQR